jgi:hypothetical protein
VEDWLRWVQGAGSQETGTCARFGGAPPPTGGAVSLVSPVGGALQNKQSIVRVVWSGDRERSRGESDKCGALESACSSNGKKNHGGRSHGGKGARARA